MDFAIGAALAVAVAIFAALVGLDRDRAFYPTVLIVVASYYGLFAVMGGGEALAAELAAMAVFVVASVVGFRGKPWLVAAALVAHGVFDWFHGGLIANPGVPPWWPGFCMGFDVVAGVWVAGRIYSLQRSTRAPGSPRP